MVAPGLRSCLNGVLHAAPFLSGAPPTAAIAATVEATGKGFVQLVTTALADPPPGGVGQGGQRQRMQLIANARGDMTASCEAAYLWLRLNIREVCARVRGLTAGRSRFLELRDGGPPLVTVNVAPLYDKAHGSMSLAFAASMAAAVVQWPLRKEVALLAEVDIRGHLVPVGGLPGKAKALHAVGVKTLLLARGSADRAELRALQSSFPMVLECDTIREAFSKCFVPAPRQPPGAAAQMPGKSVPRSWRARGGGIA